MLELDELWVDALLAAEQNMRDSNGATCLAFLLSSGELHELDFSCQRFHKLLEL